MPHPATPLRHTTAWHAAQEADERAWLDQWAQLHLIPVAPLPEPLTEPAPARMLATAGKPS
jgi:hypothetical protein